MLSERLKAMMDSAAELPMEEQEKLAEQIADLLDEALWDAQFADPRSAAFFARLAEEAVRGPLRPFPTPADLGDAKDGEESSE